MVRWMALAAGVTSLAIGVIGLFLPVTVSDGDGGSLRCGSAAAPDLSAARAANAESLADNPIIDPAVPYTDYVVACESSQSTRTAWSVPLILIGGIIVVGRIATHLRRCRLDRSRRPSAAGITGHFPHTTG